MNVNILVKKVSTNRKRVDAEVKVSSFWSGELFRMKVRLLSREAIPKGDLNELMEQVAERRQEWKPGKKFQTLSLKGINANAYILSVTDKQSEDEEE